jgi:hypothetical protein
MRMSLAKILFAFLFVLTFRSSPLVHAQDFTTNNNAEVTSRNSLVDLEDQLINGLRLTTAGQKQYIAAVLAQVQNQKLPRAMVNVVYRWSIERNSKYPFPYFRLAMNALAARRGVTLP